MPAAMSHVAGSVVLEMFAEPIKTTPYLYSLSVCFSHSLMKVTVQSPKHLNFIVRIG